MNAIRTTHFLYYPLAAALPLQASAFGSPPLEVSINEYLTFKKVEHFYFAEPNWEHEAADTVTLTPIGDYVLSRLFFLLAQGNEDLQVAEIVELDRDGLRFPFKVEAMDGTYAATLVFSVERLTVAWRGQSRSYVTGIEVVKELQELLLSEPKKLAKYEIMVPGRRKFGWTGKRFLGKKTVRRPAYYSKENIEERRAANEAPKKPPRPRTFEIQEYPVVENNPKQNASRRAFRYTDTIPPPAAWANYPKLGQCSG